MTSPLSLNRRRQTTFRLSRLRPAAWEVSMTGYLWELPIVMPTASVLFFLGWHFVGYLVG
jgi:hypothetical protein